MKKYSTVVVAVELDPDSDRKLLDKAQEIAQEFGATLWLVHSVEQLGSYGAAYGVAAGIDVDLELKNEAQALMEQMGHELGIPTERQIIVEGPAKHVILDEAKKASADLIIIGSHGRHGVRLLLGSTANAVLHGAECDVLAVRVEE